MADPRLNRSDDPLPIPLLIGEISLLFYIIIFELFLDLSLSFV